MASVLTICSLCVFQYVSVVLPMNKSLTNLRCLVMVLCAWIISIFLATGPAIRNGGAINSLQTFSTVYIITLQTEQIFPTILPWCFAVIYFLVCSVAWTPIANFKDLDHPPDFWGSCRFGLITCIAHAILLFMHSNTLNIKIHWKI